jgi:hypothetical protein
MGDSTRDAIRELLDDMTIEIDHDPQTGEVKVRLRVSAALWRPRRRLPEGSRVTVTEDSFYLPSAAAKHA